PVAEHLDGAKHPESEFAHSGLTSADTPDGSTMRPAAAIGRSFQRSWKHGRVAGWRRNPDAAGVCEPEHFGVASRLSALPARAEADGRDPLDDYVAAQVHGVVDLARDVEALVLDPCYRGTRHEAEAAGLAAGWNGTAASGCPCLSCGATPATGARSSWTWACRWPRAAGSPRGSSATRRPPGDTTSRRSSGSGITWPGSATRS